MAKEIIELTSDAKLEIRGQYLSFILMWCDGISQRAFSEIINYTDFAALLVSPPKVGERYELEHNGSGSIVGIKRIRD